MTKTASSFSYNWTLSNLWSALLKSTIQYVFNLNVELDVGCEKSDAKNINKDTLNDQNWNIEMKNS